MDHRVEIVELFGDVPVVWQLVLGGEVVWPTGCELADAGDVAGFVDHEVVVGRDVGEVPGERVIVIRAPN